VDNWSSSTWVLQAHHKTNMELAESCWFEQKIINSKLTSDWR
jgi:hypothetical protein